MGTIRVRFKQGEIPGDASAFNSYGAADPNFPRLVYPGQELDIPDDLLDDKEDFKMYRYPDKSEKMLTEKQYRAELHKFGGYDKNPHYAEPAPMHSTNKSIILPPRQMDPKQHVEFLAKQRMALLKYRHFNPVCMELISEITLPPPGKEDKNTPKVDGKPDVTKMPYKSAVDYIMSMTNETDLAELSIVLDRAQNPDPRLIQQLEMRLRNLRGQ